MEKRDPEAIHLRYGNPKKTGLDNYIKGNFDCVISYSARDETGYVDVHEPTGEAYFEGSVKVETNDKVEEYIINAFENYFKDKNNKPYDGQIMTVKTDKTD